MAACIVGNMIDLFMFIGAIILVSVYYRYNFSHIKLFSYTIAFALLETLISYIHNYKYISLLGDVFYEGKVCKFIGAIIMVYVFLLISIVYRRFS